MSFGIPCRPRLFSVVIGLFLAADGSTRLSADPPADHRAAIETSQLRAVIADNEPYAPNHQAGYNGVSELRRSGTDQPNLFVPLYAGLNLEHFFSGDSASVDWDIFEPRRVPMTLRRISDRRVELIQERTPHWRSAAVWCTRPAGMQWT